MSILEKTIGLLENMPDDKIETVYAFVRFMDSDIYEASSSKSVSPKKGDIQSMLGIAHEYANPAYGRFCYAHADAEEICH